MDNREILQTFINSFSIENLTTFFRAASGRFRPEIEDLSHYLKEDQPFADLVKVGEIPYEDEHQLVVVAARSMKGLTERSGKKRQYYLAKKILKRESYDAGIFVFYDDQGHFRFSLVTALYMGTHRAYSDFRRQTYYVSPELPNKTFLLQIGRADFSSPERVQETFSIAAVTEEFYREFEPTYKKVAASVIGTEDKARKEDFALLFAIRIIFLGFVQKKGWLGDNDRFVQTLWQAYQDNHTEPDTFYKRWLMPLFFEALNAPPGHKVAYGNNEFPSNIEAALQMAPYLNGELFKKKDGLDTEGFWIPDAQIKDFFDFLFQYNFTVEENLLYDEELELNPEFLGIIFERLVNKADGAIYTPRPEVDFMCRMALVKWLEKATRCEKRDLYHLLFREGGYGAEYDDVQKYGDFSAAEIRELISRLEEITVCDPAAGSGAFEVGMLHVLEEVLDILYTHKATPEDLKQNAPSPFERKKRIIATSLYGVEVKRWAVWINQLRLWLTLFVDMPKEYRHSMKPLLPNLQFKVRVGDSLVQRIGSKAFPVHGYAELPFKIREKIKGLKEAKRDFFYNRRGDDGTIHQAEIQIFQQIIDEEIKEKQRQLGALTDSRKKQARFKGMGAPEQKEFDIKTATAKRRQALKNEIAELTEQFHTLDQHPPFIWSIEFAEIFFDKGGFDIIIGNPPYVRQEGIADPRAELVGDTNLLSPKDYKKALQEMARIDFPDYFNPNVKISGRSDLYTYFYVRSLRLLNSKGVHVFICSNSWLDVGYGAWLQEFLLSKVPIHFVFDNHAKRSFASADINTVITVYDAPLPKSKFVKKDWVVKFVAFKQPFEEVVLSENLLEIEEAASIIRNDRFRVFPITVAELLEEGSEVEKKETKTLGNRKTYVGDKWGGKYLRAPDIFFTILEKGKGKLVKLGEIAEVRFGIKTGANDFFYLEPLGPGSRTGLLNVRNGAGWEGEIEEEFLKPVLQSLQECKTYGVFGNELSTLAFYCHHSRQELTTKKALEYIIWGEGQNYNVRPSVRGRRYWWTLPNQSKADFIIMRFRDQRNWTPIVAGIFLIGDTVFVGNSVQDEDNTLGIALNSTFSILISEIYGRKNLGEGLLTTYGPDIKPMLCVNPKLLNFSVINIDNLLTREVYSIFTESGIDPTSNIPISEQDPHPLPDRKALDDIVFDALGLTEEERKEVYRAVCQLVWNRISKAKSVKKRR